MGDGMPRDEFDFALENLEVPSRPDPDPDEIPWSLACEEAELIEARFHWGDGYDLLAGVTDTETGHRIPYWIVVDGTSQRINRLPLEPAILLVNLLAGRTGLPASRIRFRRPLELVDRQMLQRWLADLPAGSEAAAEVGMMVERLRLPWEDPQ